MRRVLAVLLFGLFALGCDDDAGTTPGPEPEPEPEAPSEPALVETRTFGADGELLFRDEYQHIDGRLHGFARRDAEGLTLATAVSAYGEDDLLGAIVFSDGPRRLFGLEDFNYLDDARLQGFARRDADGLTLDVHAVVYTTASTLQRVDVVDGPRSVYSDAFGYRDGAAAVITRLGPNGELHAHLTIEVQEDGHISRLDVSTPEGRGPSVEFDYSTDTRVEPTSLVLRTMLPLVGLDGFSIVAHSESGD